VSAGRDPDTRRYRYVHKTVEGSKRVAQRAADELAAKVQHGMHLAAREVADLLEKWMLHLETQDRVPSTMIRYRSAIDVRIVPALGSIELTKLTAADLDAFYGALLKKGLHPLSVRMCHAVLSAALHQAEKWGLIDLNPIVRSSPPPARQREIVPPTIDEVRQLIVECERFNPDLARLFTVAATTGCRRGELCGLQVRLGHANPNLTLRTYAHFREVADREAAAAMGRLAVGFSLPPSRTGWIQHSPS